MGRGYIDILPETENDIIIKTIKDKFDIKGRLDFEDMYQELESADYFLNLFDPENKAHERYLKAGTSGCFQLIYGFLKPCIIQKKFADAYNFTNNDSIIYDKNDDLAEAMKNAINLSSENYKQIQEGLKNNVMKIEKISLRNLEEILKS